ncbi:FdtA/QdtA family cupin domain-containing protein [Patescibacteria group bacterium]|nr:FdtA/QdtA family cupin domain-containing protein [Patescibacteria group bacterium]
MAKNKKSLIHIIKVPKIYDDAFLCFAQYPDQIPFEIKRIYYIFSALPGLPRGKHVHKTTRQILFCIKGKVRMVVDDGKDREEIVLTNPEDGMMLEPMVWHEMLDMDKNTILLVLASKIFDPGDYIRDYEQFRYMLKKRVKTHGKV